MIVTREWPSKEAPPPVAKEPTVDIRPLCWHCGRSLAAYVTRPWFLRCHKCKSPNKSEPE